MLVDSHCHLDYNDFEEDMDEIILRMKENGITAALNAGNCIDTLDEQLKLSEKYPFVYTAVGVHPHNADEFPGVSAAELAEKSRHKKIVAIGECGLDYYYDYSGKENQRKVFAEHIRAAQETGLPLIIHTRDADDDTIGMLSEYYKEKPFAGEIHCFSGSRRLAEFALSIGFYVSASGIITFNKSGELREIFADLPLDRLLVETDSPFLAPCRSAVTATNRPMSAMWRRNWHRLKTFRLRKSPKSRRKTFTGCFARQATRGGMNFDV